MKPLLIGIISFCFLQVICGQKQQANKGNYFIPKESFFGRNLKHYNYQLTIDTVNQMMGIITFWRTEPIFDPKQRVSWTPNISFSIYSSKDKAKCIDSSLQIRANSTCEAPNIGGDMFILGNLILFNTSPCVECSKNPKVDYCRNILKHLLEYITDTNSSDLNYVFGQLPIEKGIFFH